MRLFIATDFRTIRKNARLYLVSECYYIIKRYHDQFGELVLCSRVEEREDVKDLFDVTDIIDSFLGFSSLKDSFLPATHRLIKREIINCDLIVGRFPSFFSFAAFNIAKKKNKPLFAEVMADAWDGMWNHSIKGKIIAPYFQFETKKNIHLSNYALYVTRQYLQRRYPMKKNSIGISNVTLELNNVNKFEQKIKKYSENDYKTVSLMTTAGVDVKAKGQEYVIKAIPKINKAGIRVKYLLVGGGNPTRLEKLATRLGVLDQLEFVGRKPLPEVFELLDNVDFYIQPSLQEGLPRSVVEAMSRGCVCIGARTGGIPELLQEDAICKRKSVNDIAEKVIQFSNPEEMVKRSKYCFEKAKEFSLERLEKERNEFYLSVKNSILS